MARDSVANVLIALRERGFDPRRVGADLWESRCPAHRGTDYALAIKRTEQGQLALACRSKDCPLHGILRALDLTAARLFGSTPNIVLRELAKRPIVAPRYVGSPARSEAQARPSAPAAQSAVALSVAPSAGSIAPQRQSPETAAPRASAPAGTPSSAQLPEAGARGEDRCTEQVSLPPSLPAPASGSGGGPAPTAIGKLPSDEGASVAGAPPDNGHKTRSEPRAIDGLLRIAEEARVFRVADGRPVAQVQVEGRREIYALHSAEFRNWLIDRYRAAGGKPPSKWSLRRVTESLEASARFDAATPSLFVRVGCEAAIQGSPIYIDLGDETGRAVAVDATGWKVVERPNVAFQRPDGLLPMPVPSRDGSIELLRPYVNLNDRDFRLLIVWLAAALRPAGPYPILALYGEQGSAKTMLAKIVRRLVDPHSVPLLIEPKGTRDLMVTALNGWLLAYDNISTLPGWLSDGLCLVATGGGYAGRTEYTSLERTVFQVQRPAVLTGIDEFMRRGDLIDRAVIMHLAPIPDAQRRREDELWEAFERERGRIFGGLLDAIAGGLRELPGMKLSGLPRMADFAAAGEAIGRALGWPANTILNDYEANRREATVTQIEDSVIATALLQHAPRFGVWTGTPSALYAELSTAIGPKAAASARWPKRTERFTSELRRIAPQLRMHGLQITLGRTRSARFIALEPTGQG
jgi:hypothetical protein